MVAVGEVLLLMSEVPLYFTASRSPRSFETRFARFFFFITLIELSDTQVYEP